MNKRFGEKILGRVLELRKEGYTLREIGGQLGYEHKQIKKLIERYNRRQRSGATIPQAKGRPRTKPTTSLREKELRIKQLEREVELYRAFLQAAGRM